MSKKMSLKDFRYISVMLFGLFFGAGNLIFPVMLGKEGGSNAFISLFAFSITAIIFPILGVIVISDMEGLDNITKKVGKIFTLLFPPLIYLSIGPGLAMPRAGSVPFVMIIEPFIGKNPYTLYIRIVYTAIFFLLVYLFASKPNKIVKILGKILTPSLLTLIALVFIGAILKYGFKYSTPTNDYLSKPIIKGFLEGYNTMDTLAALNFGFFIAEAIKNRGIEDKKDVVSYTKKAGLIAGLLLLIIYSILTYIGMTSFEINSSAENGAKLLYIVTQDIFGILGIIILGAIFTLACLSVCIGLTVSISEYFARHYKVLDYRKWMILWIIISFILANFGLNNILKLSVPLLIAIYPISITIILLSLLKKVFNDRDEVYKYTILVTVIFGIIAFIEQIGIKIPIISDILHLLPLNAEGLGWLLPTAIIFLISTILFRNKKE